MERPVMIPGPSHPITIEPTAGRVVVRLGDTVVADTNAALTLQESTYPAVQYVPLVDVDPNILQPSTNTSYCPYKGDAVYYSLAGPDGLVQDSVWSYAQPYESVAPIAGHVAFYPNLVSIEIS